MSHNSKYYRKKLKKDHSSRKIDTLFRKLSQNENTFTEVSQSGPTVSSVLEVDVSSPSEVSQSGPTLSSLLELVVNSLGEFSQSGPTVGSVLEVDVSSPAGELSQSSHTVGSVLELDVSSPTACQDITVELNEATGPLRVSNFDSSVEQNISVTISGSDVTQSSDTHKQQTKVSPACSTQQSEEEFKTKSCRLSSILTTNYERHYEWLFFSASKNGYCCKYCEMCGGDPLSTSPFILGTTLGSHPNRKLRTHESSNLHAESLRKCLKMKTPEVQPTVLQQLLRRPECKEMNRTYMSTLINTAFFVIKKQWAIDSIGDILNFLHDQKCPSVLNFMANHPSVTYTSSTSVKDIVLSINTCLEKSLLTTIRNSPYIGLLADESTDEANRTQFAILIRCLDTDKTIKDHFLGIINVKKTDAATLMSEIERFLISKEIDISKILFVGFDGCNTMSGENTGLQRRFRHVVPHSLYINCRSHRLALCVKHLMKYFPVLEDVDLALLAIYKLFDNSPQKFAVFKDVQASYAEKELVLRRAAATRWLSHGDACKRVIQRYVLIIDTLDELLGRKREPEIVGVRDSITNKNTVAAILVLCDMLQPVSIFCKYLQGSVDFSMVTIKLKDLTDSLHNLIERFRGTLTNHDDSIYLGRMNELFEEIDERTVFTRRLRDRQVYTQERVVEELAIPMVHKLIQELEDGFHLSPILQSFSLFNKNHLPDNVGELQDFGNTKESRK